MVITPRADHIVAMAEHIITESAQSNRRPDQTAERIEAHLCGRCLSGRCHNCPIEGIVAKLNRMGGRWQ